MLGGGGDGKPFLPAGARRRPSSPDLGPSLLSSPSSDALAADRAAVASTATASASTTSGGSSSAASASATANARPVCSAAAFFPGAGTTRRDAADAAPLLPVCSAPSFELVADGGRCAVESRPPHAVVCVGPSVTLEIRPPQCSLGFYGDDGSGGGGFSALPSRSLIVDAHCGPPAGIATGGQRVVLGGKSLPTNVFALNGSSNGVGGVGDASLAEFDRAAAALSSWPFGYGGAPLSSAKSLAELLAVSLLPGRVTATASVVEE